MPAHLTEATGERGYSKIRVTPLIGALGAKIDGVDLREPISDEVFDEVNRAFLAYKLLVFRGQPLDLERHLALSERFGRLFVHPYIEPIEASRHVIRLIKEPEDTVNNGGTWHMDLTFMKKPPKASLLRMVDVPAQGGDTLFCDLGAAYEGLSANMKSYLDGLKGLHTSAQLFGPTGYYRHNRPTFSVSDEVGEEGFVALHPIVRTHPETQQKLLFINPPYIERIMGVPAREGSQLLDYLSQHCASGEYCTRVRWETDTLTIWDNRCTMHYALNDYHGQRREGYRVSVSGDVPF
jgi:taurine dioxygenase